MTGALLSTIWLADSKHTVRATPIVAKFRMYCDHLRWVDVRVVALQVECSLVGQI